MVMLLVVIGDVVGNNVGKNVCDDVRWTVGVGDDVGSDDDDAGGGVCGGGVCGGYNVGDGDNAVGGKLERPTCNLTCVYFLSHSIGHSGLQD